jgi:uncharacterized membrane protein HdeD (DUF308 family)
MQDRAMSTLKDNAPWRRGAAWPIIAVEGLILAAIAVYIFIDQERAGNVVRQLIAVVLLVFGVLDILAGFRNQATVASPYRILRGSVGATIGTLVLLENVADYFDPDGARIVLAIGLLFYGLIGLAAVVVARDESGLRISAIVSGGLTIALSIILFTGDAEDTTRLNLLATIALISGLLLLAYAFVLYRGRQGPAPDAAGPASK